MTVSTRMTAGQLAIGAAVAARLLPRRSTSTSPAARSPKDKTEEGQIAKQTHFAVAPSPAAVPGSETWPHSEAVCFCLVPRLHQLHYPQTQPRRPTDAQYPNL